MNKFIARAQDLGRKAAEMKHVVEGLPAQAAKLREAVTMTGGELQQLRADVQTSIHGLKADSEERLLKSMREINDHAQVFEEAGYDLNGLELDLALNQRLAVHLDKFEDVPHSALRALHGKQSSETIRSILAGIIKAEETAANVELSHLKYRGLVIHAGALPMIRMCWHDFPDVSEQKGPFVQSNVQSTVQSPAPSTPAAHRVTPAPASMFDLRAMPTGSVRIESRPAPASPPPLLVPETSAKETPAAASSWSQDALERFKKMPGISKYSR